MNYKIWFLSCQSILDNGHLTLSKLLLSLFIGSIVFSACRKENFAPVMDTVTPCLPQTANPAGRSYTNDSVVDYICTDKHCGILPLSTKNYWVYQDSIYDNGVFVKVQLDTLRYATTKKSLTDGLTWWQANNVSIGLPATLYANDSAFFTLGDRLFTPDVKDARKDYNIPVGDSVKYLTSFDDAAANGKSIKLQEPVKTSAGEYDDCIYFEKNARFYRKDQVFFKPGLGVVKYIYERVVPGSPVLKLQQVSTLVAYHIE